MSDLHEVRLLGFPIDVHARAVEHHEELMREFQILALEPTDVPRRLATLVEEMVASYGSIGIGAAADREAARARGEATVDLTYHVPTSIADVCLRLDRMLDEADEFCRADKLLTLAANADLVAFRRWSLGQFVAQVGGAEPTPWSAVVIATPR